MANRFSSNAGPGKVRGSPQMLESCLRSGCLLYVPQSLFFLDSSYVADKSAASPSLQAVVLMVVGPVFRKEPLFPVEANRRSRGQQRRLNRPGSRLTVGLPVERDSF